MWVRNVPWTLGISTVLSISVSEFCYLYLQFEDKLVETNILKVPTCAPRDHSMSVVFQPKMNSTKNDSTENLVDQLYEYTISDYNVIQYSMHSVHNTLLAFCHILFQTSPYDIYCERVARIGRVTKVPLHIKLKDFPIHGLETLKVLGGEFVSFEVHNTRQSLSPKVLFELAEAVSYGSIVRKGDLSTKEQALQAFQEVNVPDEVYDTIGSWREDLDNYVRKRNAGDPTPLVSMLEECIFELKQLFNVQADFDYELFEALEVLSGTCVKERVMGANELLAKNIPPSCIEPIRVLLCFDTPESSKLQNCEQRLQQIIDHDILDLHPRDDIPLSMNSSITTLVASSYFVMRPLCKAAFQHLLKDPLFMEKVNRTRIALDANLLKNNLKQWAQEVDAFEMELNQQQLKFKTIASHLSEQDLTMWRANLHMQEMQLQQKRKLLAEVNL